MSSSAQRWKLEASPGQLTTPDLLTRLIKRAYAHGLLGERRGLDAPHAKKAAALVERDRQELLRRYGNLERQSEMEQYRPQRENAGGAVSLRKRGGHTSTPGHPSEARTEAPRGGGS